MKPERGRRPLEVPIGEIEFRTSRASGPGGQNVNKLETRVEARWSIDDSAVLTPEARSRLKVVLASRIGSRGILRVSSQRHRSQSRNKEAALERLRSIVAKALEPKAERRATKPTQGAGESRLAEKKRRSRIKRLRSPADARSGAGDD